MKKTLLALLLALVGGAAAFAIPAYPGKRIVKQPDGTEFVLYAHGDEFCSFLTDAEGYRVELGTDGCYHRVLDAATGEVLPRYSAPKQQNAALKLQQRAASLYGKQPAAQGPLRSRVKGEEEQPYKGLVLLVDFTDRKFRMDDATAQTFYAAMTGMQGYQGYADPKYGTLMCPGSLRDYFADNSYGKFDPQFDVVGPLHVDVSQYYINKVDNAFPLMEKVLAAADPQVDFSQYDSDGDGDVDMFYVIFAGYSSSYSGNDSRLMWPFAATMVDETGEEEDIVYDGVRLARFACSAEIFGWQEDGDEYLEGIGVMAHEFAHVLGFMDHYDTSNGYQEHPNSWDLMSAGSYNGTLNNTPCALNSYEKASAGFLNPTDISGYTHQMVTLASTETSEDACVIHSLQEHVHYYMENRQPDKWDKGLEHHGLLVWRIDSVRPEYWAANALNVTTRACMRLVRADGTKGSWMTGVVDGTTDPFPGTASVTVLNNNGRNAAHLLSFDQYPCPVELSSITEFRNKINFTVDADEEAEPRPVTHELPKTMKASAERLVGDTWVPVEWTVRSGVVNSNGTEQKVLFNLLPNDVGITSDMHDYSNGVYVAYTYGIDETTITVNAQRVALESDRGIWLCNYTDAEASGAGAITFNVGRYGLISLADPTITLGYVAQSRNAYVINQSKFIERLSTYRNLTFEEVGEGTAIEEIGISTQSSSGKHFVNGRFEILKNGNIYGADAKLMK